jgi:hypothetical protein
MPAHERLGQREPLQDPQPVDVGERPVEEPEGAQFVRLVDDRRDRRADAGG